MFLFQTLLYHTTLVSGMRRKAAVFSFFIIYYTIFVKMSDTIFTEMSAATLNGVRVSINYYYLFRRSAATPRPTSVARDRITRRLPIRYYTRTHIMCIIRARYKIKDVRVRNTIYHIASLPYRACVGARYTRIFRKQRRRNGNRSRFLDDIIREFVYLRYTKRTRRIDYFLSKPKYTTTAPPGPVRRRIRNDRPPPFIMPALDDVNDAFL